MMYRLKKIITYDEEIPLPKCMYNLKRINNFAEVELLDLGEEIDINVSKQVNKFLQVPNRAMADLEQRQDQLLKKLDDLYDRIKSISSISKAPVSTNVKCDASKKAIPTPDEIVFVTSPDNLPWFMNAIQNKLSANLNLSWHVHSSVPNEKVAKVKAFVKILQPSSTNSKVTLRLIFKNVSVDSELKLSSLDVPIVGNVNILRYISLVHPEVIPYDEEDHNVEALLDLCHVLERTSEKNKEAVVKKIFSQYNGWIINQSFSIVDLAAYNVIKQWRNCPKYVPKEWFDKCEKLSL